MLVYQVFEPDNDSVIPEPRLWPKIPEGTVVYASDSHWVLAEIPERDAEAFLEESNMPYIMTYTRDDVPDGWYFGTCSQVYVANGVVRDDLTMLQNVLEALPYGAVIEHTGVALGNWEFVGDPYDLMDKLDCQTLLTPCQLQGRADDGVILVFTGTLLEEFVVYTE